MGVLTLKQSSFSAGLISPQLLSRADTEKFASGLLVGNNVQVRRFGSCENRPGTQYLDAVGIYQNSTPWDPAVTYALNMTVVSGGIPYVSLTSSGNLNQNPATSPAYWATIANQGYARIIKFVFDYSHSYELIFSRNQIAIYKAGSHVVVPAAGIAAYSNVTPYQIGNIVTSAGVVYICQTPNTGYLPASNPRAWLPMTATTGGYLLTIPVNTTQLQILDSALSTIQAVNENDVMTVVCGQFAPFQLTRFSDTSWQVTQFTVSASISAPTAVGATAGTAGAIVFSYQVTAIALSDGSESLASATANCTGGTPTPTNPNVIVWAATTGAASYKVYRLINGIAGLVGTTTLTTLNDQNVQPDFSQQPPVLLTDPNGQPLFSSQFPSAVCIYQQRLIMAATTAQPTTFWASRVGNFTNFSVGTPIADDDAMEVVVAGEQSQPIIAMLDLQKLIIHTGSAEYACSGNQSGALTPSQVNCTLQGSAGAALPRPVVVGGTDVFVQSRGTRIRNLEFSIQTYSFRGKDLTMYVPQLFAGLTITGMTWQQIPDSIIWFSMSNGTMLGCTYVEDERIWAWTSQSFTNGFAEDVCAVPDATADTVYMIMRRTINGNTVRYLEAFANRDYQDKVFYSDYFGADCGLTYNGAYTYGIGTTTSGGWTQSDLITINLFISEANLFTAADVTNGSQVVATLYDSTTGQAIDRVTFSITNYVNPYQVQGYPQRTVPTWAQGPLVLSAGKAVKTFSGFLHLKGQQISALGDGQVLACPLESTLPGLIPTPLAIVTVANDGTFTLPKPALNVSAGLPIQWDLETLPLENSNGTTIMNKQITIKEATPIVYYSRPAFIGQDANHLLAMRFPVGPNPPPFQYGWPPAPFTGPHRQTIQGTPERTGQVWLRGIYPVPFGMSGVIITGESGT